MCLIAKIRFYKIKSTSNKLGFITPFGQYISYTRNLIYKLDIVLFSENKLISEIKVLCSNVFLFNIFTLTVLVNYVLWYFFSTNMLTISCMILKNAFLLSSVNK